MDSLAAGPVATIAEQLVESYGRLLPPDRAWLQAQGVPPLAIYMHPGPIGRTHDAEPTYIHPVYSNGEFSDVIGAVAWQQRDPSRFRILDGAGDDVLGLGQHFLTDAADRRGSLAVVANPLEWLKRYGACFCPLRWPDAAFELLHLNRIIALPAASGPELRHRLDAVCPRLPRIVVRAA